MTLIRHRAKITRTAYGPVASFICGEKDEPTTANATCDSARVDCLECLKVLKAEHQMLGLRKQYNEVRPSVGDSGNAKEETAQAELQR